MEGTAHCADIDCASCCPPYYLTRAASAAGHSCGGARLKANGPLAVVLHVWVGVPHAEILRLPPLSLGAKLSRFHPLLDRQICNAVAGAPRHTASTLGDNAHPTRRRTRYRNQFQNRVSPHSTASTPFFDGPEPLFCLRPELIEGKEFANDWQSGDTRVLPPRKPPPTTGTRRQAEMLD